MYGNIIKVTEKHNNICPVQIIGVKHNKSLNGDVLKVRTGNGLYDH
jgi:hypothetical protein